MAQLTDGGDGTGKGIVAERLGQLFATVTPLGKPYTLHEVADGINARAGEHVVSVQYLSQLRNGDRRHPSYEKLGAIADWFGVGADYFIGAEAARRTDEELRVLDLMRDPGVRRVAFMAKGIGPDRLNLIIRMLEMIRKADGLAPVADGSDGESVVAPQRRPRPDAPAGRQGVWFF